MKKNPKVRGEHPLDKELVRFVEGKSSKAESHVKSCRVCARKIRLICDDEEKMQRVKIDIQMGAVLERFAPAFQRLHSMRLMAQSALSGRKETSTRSRLTVTSLEAR